MKEFKEYVRSLSLEYLEKSGSITAEFSTSKDKIFEKMIFLSENRVDSERLSAVWEIFPCEICLDSDKEKGLHVQLVRTLSAKERLELHNIDLLKSDVALLKKENLELKNTIDNRVIDKKGVCCAK